MCHIIKLASKLIIIAGLSFTSLVSIIPTTTVMSLPMCKVDTTLLADREGNFIELGDMTQFTIPYTERRMTLSKDGGLAQTVNYGDTITKRGAYSLTLRESGVIVQFQITAPIEKVISTQEQFGDLLQTTLIEGLNENYFMLKMTDEENVELAKYYHSQLDSLRCEYPVIMDIHTNVDFITKKIGVHTPTYVVNGETHTRDTTLAIEKLNQFINTLDLKASDLELEIKVIDYLVNNYTYDYVEADAYGTYYYAHSLQGIVHGDKLVCDGYSKVFMYIMNTIGLPTHMIGGTSDGEGHMWNRTMIDGNWYYIDVTWTDIMVENGQRDDLYVNKTAADFELTHEWDLSWEMQAN